MKKDKYFRERGGTAKIINVNCMKCGNLIFVYQKDGPGWLKRCYLNRILWPEEYSKLINDKNITLPSQLKNLVCVCGNVLGSPMQHKDKRIAFHLIRGKFKRSNNKSGEWS
ncbi:MAG: hypothetical protein WCK90_00460 [archaeon]